MKTNRKIFVFILILLTLLLSQQDRATAIYNGTVANGKYQWMVNIVAEDGGLGFIDDRFCGGVLVDSKWVLTAHHCWRDDSGKGAYYDYPFGTEFFAIIGGLNYDSPQNEKIYLSGSPITFSYGDYSFPGVDLALWELSSHSSKLPVQIGTTSVIESLISNQESFTTMGYGKTNLIDFNSDDLMEISFTSLDTSQYSNFLASDISSGDPSTCGRDSGGPLIYFIGSQRFLAGLVHGGNTSNCGSVSQMIFEQVPDYTSWIHQTIDPITESNCVDNSITNHSGDILRIFNQIQCYGDVWSTNQLNQQISIGNFAPYSLDIQPGYSVIVYNPQSPPTLSACYSGDLWDMRKDYYPGTSHNIANYIGSIKLISGSCPSNTPDAPPSPDTSPLPPGPQGSGGGVRIFQYPNYEGELLYTFNVGFSNEPNAEGYSLQIPSGWSVITYRGDNHTGMSRCWSESVNNLQDHDDWQTKIQSLQIYRDFDACATEPPSAPEQYVRLWNDTNYSGWVGTYGLGFHDDRDQSAESVQIPAGWSIFVYQGHGREIRSQCFNTNVPDFSQTGGWENKIVGLEVFNVDYCQGTPHNYDVVVFVDDGFHGLNYGRNGFSAMDNVLSTSFDGKISSIYVKPGKSVRVFQQQFFDFESGYKCFTTSQPTMRSIAFDHTNVIIGMNPPNQQGWDSNIRSFLVYDNDHCDASPDMPESAWGYSNNNGNLALGQFVMSAEENDNQSITVEWDQTSDTTATGYHLYEHVDDDVYVLVATNNGRTNTTRTFDNLPCGTDYHYLVKSFNQWGDSASPNLVAVSTPSCYIEQSWGGAIYLPLVVKPGGTPPPTEGPTPNVPTNLHQTNVGQNSISVSWNDNSSVEDLHEVWFKPTNGGSWLIGVVGANQESYMITGLSCSTSYHIVVRAVNQTNAGTYYSESAGIFPSTQDCNGLLQPVVVSVDHIGPWNGAEYAIANAEMNSLSVDYSYEWWVSDYPSGSNERRVPANFYTNGGWEYITGLSLCTTYNFKIFATKDGETISSDNFVFSTRCN